MFDLWRNKRNLKKKQLELSIKEHESAIKILDSALEARNDIVDTDAEKGFVMLGTTDTEITEQSHKDMLIAAYRLYHTNTHARAIVRSMVKFVLGKGPTIVFDEENNQKVKDVWENFRKINKMNKREKEIATRMFRDGEFFLRKYVNKNKNSENSGETKIRFIRASRVAKPNDKNYDEKWSYGIKTNPEDIEEPILYCLVDSQGNKKEEIKAEEVIHEKILCDSDQKRGISILRVSAKRIRQYDEWLEDRIVLNKVRSAIALVRTVDSSSAKVGDIRSQNMVDHKSATKKKQKMFARGTILTASKGIEYSMLSPKIQASDVVEDGRAMLLAIAAASGLPEMLFTADYSNANYSSTLVAQNPFVREIEDWQDFLQDFYKELVEIVIQNAIDYGSLPKETKTGCKVEFPPMIQAEVEKLAKAFEILFKYRIVSKKTWRGKMGLDDDEEKGRIKDEEGDEIYPPGMTPGQGQPVPGQGPQLGQKSPFNMPIAPVNQFGAEIIELLGEGKIKEASEKAEELIEYVESYEKED